MNSLRCRDSLNPIALERVLLRELGQSCGRLSVTLLVNAKQVVHAPCRH